MENQDEIKKLLAEAEQLIENGKATETFVLSGLGMFADKPVCNTSGSMALFVSPIMESGLPIRLLTWVLS